MAVQQQQLRGQPQQLRVQLQQVQLGLEPCLGMVCGKSWIRETKKLEELPITCNHGKPQRLI